MKKSLFVFLAASLLLGTRYAASQTNDELEAQVRAAEIGCDFLWGSRSLERSRCRFGCLAATI